ncbi:unnamed protein product, partial [Cylicostephanus goldi]
MAEGDAMSASDFYVRIENDNHPKGGLHLACCSSRAEKIVEDLEIMRVRALNKFLSSDN